MSYEKALEREIEALSDIKRIICTSKILRWRIKGIIKRLKRERKIIKEKYESLDLRVARDKAERGFDYWRNKIKNSTTDSFHRFDTPLYNEACMAYVKYFRIKKLKKEYKDKLDFLDKELAELNRIRRLW